MRYLQNMSNDRNVSQLSERSDEAAAVLPLKGKGAVRNTEEKN